MKKILACLAVLSWGMGLAWKATASETNSSESPSAPPKMPAVITKIERTIGVCQLIENPAIPPGTAVNALGPITSVWGYLQRVEQLTSQQLPDEMFLSAKTSLIQVPEHGELKRNGRGDDYRYYPTTNYLGTDHAILSVEIGTYKIRVMYHIKVMKPGIGGTEGYDPYMQKENCPNGTEWRISTISGDRVAVLNAGY